jgi:hypothetical protein
MQPAVSAAVMPFDDDADDGDDDDDAAASGRWVASWGVCWALELPTS